MAPLVLVLSLALGTRSDGSQEISFKMQKDNILAMFPLVWVFPLGNSLLCCMYKTRILSGGVGAGGMFCVQGPNDSDWALSALYGKTAMAHLGFYGRRGMWIKN